MNIMHREAEFPWDQNLRTLALENPRHLDQLSTQQRVCAGQVSLEELAGVGRGGGGKGKTHMWVQVPTYQFR
jgi:hypothetical protein